MWLFSIASTLAVLWSCATITLANENAVLSDAVEDCAAMDIIFALDGFQSLSEVDYGKMKNFAKYTMMTALNGDVRAKVVQYREAQKDETPFMTSVRLGIKAVSELPYRRGPMYLEAALGYIKSDVLPQMRPKAQKYVVIVSDGHSASDPPALAEMLKAMGVKIYAVVIQESLIKELGAVTAVETTGSLMELFSGTRETGRLRFVPQFEDLTLQLAEAVYKKLCRGFGGSSVVKPTVPAHTSPAPVDYDCSRKDDGNYPFKANCSTEFVMCSNGFPYLQRCPHKLYFNPKSQVCDTWYYVKGCSGHERTTTTTTTLKPGEENLVETTPAPEFNCLVKSDRIYADPKSPCSQHFFMCDHGRTTKHFCPRGLFFDSKFRWCDRWTKVFACSGITQVVTTPTPAPSTTTQEPHPIDCSSKVNGDYNDPLLDCSKTYYTCDNHRSVKRTCPSGMFFDSVQQLCDSHDYVIACGGSPRTTTTTVASITTSKPYPDFDCSKRPPGNYGAAPCVAYYFTCVNSYSVHRPCPSHLRYDAEIDKCELEQFVPSCGGQRTTTPASTIAPPPTAEPVTLPIDCEQKKDGVYVHPYERCSFIFYKCANGRTFEYLCPTGLYFNPKMLWCEEFDAACQT